MYRADAEVLFPPRLIPGLRHLRAERWQQLVDHVLSLPESDPDALAFCLMMVRLNNCVPCQADSFRALGGCTRCTHQTLQRYPGSDEDMFRLWEDARRDLKGWLSTAH